jgi:cytochrome c-type protein NapB
MTTRTLALLAAVPLLACATAKPAAIPAADLGLQKGPVMEAAVPPKLVVNETSPGEALPPAPSYRGVAPVIPHGIDGMTPVTPKENACTDCHAVAVKEKGGPTPIPRSHHVDLRNAPDAVAAKVVDTRYVCLSCHVEGTGAKPLVRSDFRP